MAKKIRFPLEMDGGVEVRDIESLRENFSLGRVMGYLADGKLITWLRDRYADDLADAIEALDKESASLAKEVCEILGVTYDETSEENLEKAAERNRKLSLLKEYTSESKYIDNVDCVAFEQDDLYDLLDEGVEIIYLCGDKFSIPLAKKGIKYVGINNPEVVIDSKIEVDWNEKKISLSGVKYDSKYQSVVDSAEEAKKIPDEKIVEDTKSTVGKAKSTESTCAHNRLEYQIQSLKEGFKDLSMEEQAKALAEDALVCDCALFGVSLPEKDEEKMDKLIVSLNKRDNLEEDVKKYIAIYKKNNVEDYKILTGVLHLAHCFGMNDEQFIIEYILNPYYNQE